MEYEIVDGPKGSQAANVKKLTKLNETKTAEGKADVKTETE